MESIILKIDKRREVQHPNQNEIYKSKYCKETRQDEINYIENQ
jgi:hypothetical protein